MLWQRVILLVVVLVLLLMAASEGWDAYRFTTQMLHSEGTVVDLYRDTEESGFHFHPVVSYHDGQGTEYRHVPNIGGDSTDYAIGDKVTVWYQPGEPAEAQLHEPFELWSGPLFTLLVALLLPLLWPSQRAATPAASVSPESSELHTGGRPVIARLEGVQHHTEVKLNGVSPYRLRARWWDPEGQRELIFFSQDLWFDPGESLRQYDSVTVYLDPKRPDRYFMDVSFLFHDKE